MYKSHFKHTCSSTVETVGKFCLTTQQKLPYQEFQWWRVEWTSIVFIMLLQILLPLTQRTFFLKLICWYRASTTSKSTCGIFFSLFLSQPMTSWRPTEHRKVIQPSDAETQRRQRHLGLREGLCTAATTTTTRWFMAESHAVPVTLNQQWRFAQSFTCWKEEGGGQEVATRLSRCLGG